MIVTTKVQERELPAASSTTYVTVVTPKLAVSWFGNSLPVSVVAPERVCVTEVTAQLSLAVGITSVSILAQLFGSVASV